MGGYHWLNITRDEIIDTIESPVNKQIGMAIFDAFLYNGLRFKVRSENIPKNFFPSYGYSVYFYIKGSKETIIMNTYFFKYTFVLITETPLINWMIIVKTYVTQY